jgi:hypothetical protein
MPSIAVDEYVDEVKGVMAEAEQVCIKLILLIEAYELSEQH